MSASFRVISSALCRSALATALLLAVPLIASAQDDSATAMHDMPGMDHASMQGMAMPPAQDTPPPVAKRHKKHAAPKLPTAARTDLGTPSMDRASMPDMQHPAPATQGHIPNDVGGMDHSGMQGMDHGAKQGAGSMPGMQMEPMQGGSPPPNARSPDYSDGLTYGSMKGMFMLDDAPLGILRIDQLEAFHGSDANGQAWELEGWYGNDVNKFWLRSEGERSGGKLEDASVEAFWNRNVATFWSAQVGARHDFGTGPSRTWAAFGVQGLAPYWFETEATVYVGASGRTAARLRADYELLLTQRLILQPEVEVNFYGKDDPTARIGSGLSDAHFGLRLRYEIRRQLAPYIGVNWVRRVGMTPDFARDDRQPVLDRQIVAGFRIWF